MEVGKHLVRIKDYGISIAKSGGLTVFIEVTKNGESMRWFGSPIKKDGNPNDMCLAQLTACGFDPSVNSIEDLNGGPESQILITDEDIECQIGPETSPIGDTLIRIKWIGAPPKKVLGQDEIRGLMTDEQRAALKASASKFKVRKKAPKQDPEEEIAF